MRGDSEPPPFSLVRPKYDQTTYLGRMLGFMEFTSPLNLLYTSSQLDGAKSLLKTFEKMNPEDKKSGGTSERILPEGVSDEDLWKAKRIVSSMEHPDTNEIIPLPLRWGAFVPLNIPICAGMTVYGNTMGAQLAWQAINQVYNCGVNFANGNKTVEVSLEESLKSAGLATTVACAVVMGLRRVTTRIEANKAIKPWLRTFASRSVPFVAVACAGAFNVTAMRSKEAVSGVDVYDRETGDIFGKSKLAGRMALVQSALTRVVLPLPIIFLPPYIIDAIKGVGIVGRAVAGSFAVGLALEIGVISVCLLYALPAAIALFPQEATMDVNALEPEFQNLVSSKTGEKITTLAFNKGT